MDAKELQILDWVSLGDNCQNARVGNIFTHNILATCEDGENVYLDYFFPIPLTLEILEANGWKLLSNFDREAYYSKDGEFNLNIHNGRLRLFINSCVVTIEYVHELQHALRLCGLNGLADNIKLN